MVDCAYIDGHLEPFPPADEPVCDREDDDSAHDRATVVHGRLGHWHRGWPGKEDGNVDAVAEGEKIDGQAETTWELEGSVSYRRTRDGRVQSFTLKGPYGTGKPRSLWIIQNRIGIR